VDRRRDLAVAPGVARKHRAPVDALSAVDLHAVDVRRVTGAELRGDARRQVLAVRAGRHDHGVEAAALGDRRDRGREALADVVGERRVFRDEDLLRAEARHLGRGGLGAGADDEHGERSADLLGERDRRQRRLPNLAFVELCNDQSGSHVHILLR
jgi:hypothetical protein